MESAIQETTAGSHLTQPIFQIASKRTHSPPNNKSTKHDGGKESPDAYFTATGQDPDKFSTASNQSPAGAQPPRQA